MTDAVFNLLDEPWIPVRKVGNETRLVSLIEAFEHANDIEDIVTELPTQSMSIYRLLIAICYRTIELHNGEDWDELWNHGLPTGEILEYLQSYHERFYLIGGERPFMQAPQLKTTNDQVADLTKIIADIPNGEQLFITRTAKSIEKISFAEAALWLIHAHAYDPSGIRAGAVGDDQVKAGKGYPIGPSWSGQAGLVLLCGQNLEETLMLNLVPYGTGGMKGPLPWKTPCTWEAEEIESARRRDFSLLADGDPDPEGIGIPRLLTWHSRRIRLVADTDGVTGVVLAQGDKLSPQNMHLYEPMSLWRYSDPQSKKFKIDVYMPRKHEVNRALWRSVPTFLPHSVQTKSVSGEKISAFRQPATLAFQSYNRYQGTREFPVYLKVRAVGITYGPQEATIEDLYSDEITMALAVLRAEEEQLRLLVDNAIGVTDEIAGHIARFASSLGNAMGIEQGDKLQGFAARIVGDFYAMIDDDFRSWLARINEDTVVEQDILDWKTVLEKALQTIRQRVAQRVPRNVLLGTDVTLGSAEARLQQRVSMTFRQWIER